MKNIILVVLILVNVLLFAESNYKIIDSKTNKEIELKLMVEELGKYDVIFFGEFHDNKILHELEFSLLKMFFQSHNNLIISLEMFERDVQSVLDNYLSGEITEEEFLANSRPWPNYTSDYRSLIEFAKDHNLEVIASNIPRKYSALISKQGSIALDSLTVEAKKFVAKRHLVYDDEYKLRFMKTMQQNMAHMPNNPMAGKMNFELLYAAQCIKDDTMAESILKYQRIPPRRKVIHYNGDFHSRKHLGTAQKLKINEPMLRIAVISPLLCSDEFSWDQEDLKEGDFLILLQDVEE